VGKRYGGGFPQKKQRTGRKPTNWKRGSTDFGPLKAASKKAGGLQKRNRHNLGGLQSSAYQDHGGGWSALEDQRHKFRGGGNIHLTKDSRTSTETF